MLVRKYVSFLFKKMIFLDFIMYFNLYSLDSYTKLHIASNWQINYIYIYIYTSPCAFSWLCAQSQNYIAYNTSSSSSSSARLFQAGNCRYIYQHKSIIFTCVYSADTFRMCEFDRPLTGWFCAARSNQLKKQQCVQARHI